ncbi:alcohol dehydrogenase [Talaromyces proteolyticus]|uniref:Alcohol dehydrogenase n=1 Tax=Talaromyces proteolyticus TaxID=1131652 RepID=A0AAD4KIC9_9EURO|nr:alcohol dehydrogenase [Talaromyces proteolyticus]KAH8692325.1 alcohol dehydrogenase [Talaromyces proteolyticus]
MPTNPQSITVPTHRHAWRRTDDYTPGTAKIKLITESLPLPLDPTLVLVKIHAVSLNYRDANIAHGGNPWPVIPNGILGNDASGEVIGVGDKVKDFKIGDRVAPVTDTELITGRESGRSWLAANEDGVMADYIVFDESRLVKLPVHLDWVSAATIPCAGTTAWSAVKGARPGKTVLIQAGARVILSSSSDEKLVKIKEQYPNPPILTVNYRNPTWHEEVLRLTSGVGVDIVVENGGAPSLVQSMKCTRRGGVISQVGYLGKQDPELLEQLIPTIIDRRVVLRGINAGTKYDTEDLCEALSAHETQLDDIIDKVYPFSQAEEALQFIWDGRQIGKVVLRV